MTTVADERHPAGRADGRLTVSAADASFVLQIDRRALERLVLGGELEYSELHDAKTITVESLEALVQLRIAQGLQSLLARWALEQLVSGRLEVPRSGPVTDGPRPLLDAIAPVRLPDLDGPIP